MKLLSQGIQNLELGMPQGQNGEITPNYFERYRDRYSDQGAAVSGQ